MTASVWNPGAPSAITPIPLTLTLFQSTAVANTPSQAEGNVLGAAMLQLRGKYAITGVGVAGNQFQILITATGYTWRTSSNGISVGQFIYTTAGGTKYEGTVYVGNPATGQLLLVANNNAGNFGQLPAITAAIGDTLVFAAIIPLA